MRKTLLLIFVLTMLCSFVKAQVNIDTPNLSFDDGSLNGWKVYTGEYYFDNITSSPTYGLYAYRWTPVTASTNRISIISNNSSTYDPVIACNLLTNPTNKSVVRLGNPTVCESWKNGSPYIKYSAAEKIEYTFKVTKNTTLLSYKLAAVLHTPLSDNHLGEQRPSYSMDITVIDTLGASYSLPCTSYSSIAAAGSGLIQNSNCLSSSAGTKRLEFFYQPWISGNVDLSAQIGKTVTITIKTHDCLLNTAGLTDVAGSHSAHGYFWAETKKIELTSFSCENSDATIVAPQGFSSYQWTRSDGKPITIPDATQPWIVSIEKSQNLGGIVYSCAMDDSNSACGAITVSTTIAPVKLHPNFTNVAIDAGKIQFTNTSTAEGDSITDYYWDFGDGVGYSNLKNPTYTYSDFKPFNVKLTVTSSKGCNKTTSQNVLPTKELIASIFPPANLAYNGQTKDFTASTNIAGLQMNIDYYIRYTNRAGTAPYTSYTAPATAGDYTATFELSYLSLLKYFMNSVPSMDFSITKAPLVVTANNVTKTYGEKITLLREAFTQDMKPLYAGDKIYELELLCNGLNDTASVGTYSITPTKAIGLGVDNYDIQFVAGTLTVNPKLLNIAAIDKAKTYGDQLNATGNEFFISPGSLVGNDTVSFVSLQCNGFDKLAAAGTYIINASGATGVRLSNYSIKYTNASIIVNKKKITVTAKKLNKTYGTEYIFSGKEFDTDLTQFIENDSITKLQFISTATPGKAPMGDYALSVTGTSGYRLDNYDIKLINNEFRVNPMPITITANNKNKEYGDLLTFSGSEFSTNKPLISGDTVSFVLLKSSGCIETAPIGKYDILTSLAYGAGTLNYDFTYTPGTLNIVKKKLIASIYPPDYLGYNAKNKEFTASVNVNNLLQNADYYIRYTNKPGTPAYNSTTAPCTTGNYTATFELNSASLLKYDLVSTPVQDFTITKAPLTITADNTLKTYGDKLNLLKDAFKTDIKPLFGSDRISELELSCNGLNDTASVGKYPIIPTKAIGLGVENYDIRFAAGELTVYPKSLLIRAVDATKTYGENLTPTGKEFFVDSRYLVGNDTIFAVNLQSNGYTHNAKTGTYPVKASNATGRRLNNYLISYTDATLQVTRKKITVSANAVSKLYGNIYNFNGREFSTDFSQFIGTDTITSVQFSSQGTLKQSPVDDYTITITGITGSGLENYDIKQLNSTLKVTPLAITVIANNITKPYGGLLSLNGSEFTTDKPLLNGDVISFVVLKSSGCSETAPVSQYDIFALLAYGVGTMNYDFTYKTGKLSVVQKTLSAKIHPPSYLVYNAQNKEFTATVSISGLVQNTDYYIRYTNKAGTKAYNSFTAPATVGDYTASFELSSLSLLKYSMDTVPSRDFTISKAPLTITADNATKTYGEKLNLQKDAFKMDMKPLFGSDVIYEAEFECKGLTDTASVKNYPVTPVKVTGSGVENYDIRYVPGTLTINPKQLNIKALDNTKTYGNNVTPDPRSFYVNARDLVGNDAVTSVTLVSDGYNRLATVGSYIIKASNAMGIRMNNYQISYSDASLQVTKKKISVLAKPVTKIYGSEYIFKGDEFEADLTQLIGSDKITGVKLNSQGAQKKASVGEYALSITDVLGFRLDNYDIIMHNGLLLVNQLPIVVTAKDMEKEYGDVLTFTGNEFTTNVPLLNNDTISFVFFKSSGVFESTPIGEYDIIPSQAFGAGSLNYSISYRTGKLKITQKQLQVIARSCVKEYGENDPEMKFSVVDKRGVEYQPSMFSGNIIRALGEKVGEYIISKGTLSISPSYSYIFTNAKLTIKKALPSLDPSFTNNEGQFIIADVLGSKNGDNPQGSLNIKIKQTSINNTFAVKNGESKCAISALPNQMVEAELNYMGDDNYLPATKTMKIYAINYHCNGGKLVAPITNFDGSESVKLETPAQDNNYKFEGWYENEDFSGVQIRRIPIATYRDVHLYAKWSVTYDDLSIVALFNQVLAVANPLNRDFINKSTFKWYKDGVQLSSTKQYCGFENYIPSGIYRVEIYYLNNAPIVLEYNHSATMQKSKVYPNPLKIRSELTVYSELDKPDDVSVEVYNSLGVRQTSVTAKRDNEKFMLNGFAGTGIYIIRLIQNGKIKEIHKVIVEE